ncbi:MAG: alanine:cation symporter family protein [Parachlamydiales bacterium]|nr:alanine:cation symporter family protein [Parachlamydiales bacterium]
MSPFQETFTLIKYLLFFFLLTIVLYAAKGGIKRIAKICTFFMPIFMVLYTFMCLYIVFSNFDILSDLVKLVFKSAFFG